jgi:hypothetical protein
VGPGADEAWFETAVEASVGGLERGALRRIVPDTPDTSSSTSEDPAPERLLEERSS